MKFTILTLFPELFPGVLGESLLGKALADGKWELNTVNIRDFANDVHKTVDDTPYGGGAGMVIKPDILSKAIDSVQPQPDKWIYMSPRGKLWNQRTSEQFMEHAHIGIICGRYEGVDERVLKEYNIEEVSIGDYVLSGGEIAAYALIDTCIRQVNGVLGNAQTVGEESFSQGDYENLLEYPHFTRPAKWREHEVPQVLKDGNHAHIESWRKTQAEELTRVRRPDLWVRYQNDNKKD